MTDEGLVLDHDAFTNKTMAGDFAILPNGYVLLNFNERSDFRVLSDLAAVKVDEFRELNSLSQFHVWSNRAEFVHKHNPLSFFLNGSSATGESPMRANIAWKLWVALEPWGKLPPLTPPAGISDFPSSESKFNKISNLATRTETSRNTKDYRNQIARPPLAS